MKYIKSSPLFPLKITKKWNFTFGFHINACLILLFLSFILNGQNKERSEILNFDMDTPWTKDVNPEKVWDVYPRPQLVRNNWKNLNGYWNYTISPINKKEIPDDFEDRILVPFAIESKLSGVKKLVGKNNYLWYKKVFEAPELNENELLHLNFEAVDWEAVVYLNGKEAGRHKGGFTNFSIDVTKYLNTDSRNELIVRVWDPTDKGTQARGKQSVTPQGIWYTPVTGIWQTVWLEKTSKTYLENFKATPDIDRSILAMELKMNQTNPDVYVEITVLDQEKTIFNKRIQTSKLSKITHLNIPIKDQKLWSPEDPFLYDLQIQITDQYENVLDRVKSYFGMRKISLGKDDNGKAVIELNNKRAFNFGLLDQGWWPDGLYTAPTPEAMIWDIDKTLDMGFNTIRKHVKTEPATFYYECDKKGVLVWQDMPNGNYLHELRLQAWEQDVKRPVESALQYEYELREMIDQLYHFPSIVVWVPFNEGWGQYDTERIANWVSYYDPSRLNDAPSGWADRGVGDLIDVHIYPGPGMEKPDTNRASVIGEFGGLGLTVEDHLWWDKKNWGYLTYGHSDKFKSRFLELISDLKALKNFGLSAAIYTQTTDVEGEVNGLITYDRKVVKINPDTLKEMIMPLYQEPTKPLTIIEDSEYDSNTWLSYKGNNNMESILNQRKSSDKEWETVKAPFSSYDNFFLPSGTSWKKGKTLILKKQFNLNKIPNELYFKYYLTKASAKIYINGDPVLNEKYQGGRKRHYRLKDVSENLNALRKGKNEILIELVPDTNTLEYSFDMGIYSAEKNTPLNFTPTE